MTIAALFCALFTVLLPAFAFAAHDGSCEHPSQENQEERAATLATTAKLIKSEPISSSELASTPCERARQEGAQGYNLCFEANPYPSTAVPEWVAKRQAEEAVGAVFDQIIAIHTEEAARAPRRPRALENLPGRAWLADAIQVLQEQAPVDGGSICIETDETCQEAPTPGQAQQISTTIPADEGREEIERPRPATKEVSQPPLVALNVGPAKGFASAKERPPRG